jgi:hypothetical protein
MFSMDIPNLPGMLPSKDQWMYRQHDGFKKTKNSRPNSASAERATVRTDIDLNKYYQRDNSRPASANITRTPVIRAARPNSGKTMHKTGSLDCLPATHGVYGVSISTLGSEEEKIKPKVESAHENIAKRGDIIARFYGTARSVHHNYSPSHCVQGAHLNMYCHHINISNTHCQTARSALNMHHADHGQQKQRPKTCILCIMHTNTVCSTCEQHMLAIITFLTEILHSFNNMKHPTHRGSYDNMKRKYTCSEQ